MCLSGDGTANWSKYPRWVSDQPPVLEVAEGPEHVAAQLAELGRWGEGGGVEDHRREHEEQGGEQPPDPSSVELDDRDPAGSLPFGDEQRRDQEAGEDEEDVDAEEPAARPADLAMEQQRRSTMATARSPSSAGW